LFLDIKKNTDFLICMKGGKGGDISVMFIYSLSIFYSSVLLSCFKYFLVFGLHIWGKKAFWGEKALSSNIEDLRLSLF